MKPLNLVLLFICLFCNMSCDSDDTEATEPEPIDETIYFPPINSDTWETKTISELNWNEDQLQPLLDFLDAENSKGFIILHNGKIVVETYFNNHSASTPWYWASAGKTLTTALTGIAQQDGLIDINAKVSDYIGTGWTSAPLDKENLITCKNLLSMNSGLNDGLGDDISASNLQYLADAGDRWAYHNVYVKLQDVVTSASGTTWNNYFNTNLKDKIGMTGLWLQNGNFNVYWSNTRSMARFGLLTFADGTWENEQIIPENFLNEAINTSQNINQAYGYLWWLNGKTTFRLPQSQVQFNGELIPNAPADMYCALGRDDQKIYVVPSKNLVIVRMGEAADSVNFALSSFDNELWSKINALIN
ncbi:MAG: serine hydrolase domain-containing protein [Winogradskyella sp.]|uniref:serine hydrolase domain-containing protein n=1 Tax=Winogradskyella sp. TaxID=1883156 RepID=UPI00385DB528